MAGWSWSLWRWSFVGASVAYYAEHPTNPEYKTYGDSLWWAIVTLTTVGYGDIVPETAAGRWAAVFIMVTGVAVLGLLAGTLASFFRIGSDADALADAAPLPRADAGPRRRAGPPSCVSSPPCERRSRSSTSASPRCSRLDRVTRES